MVSKYFYLKSPLLKALCLERKPELVNWYVVACCKLRKKLAEDFFLAISQVNVFVQMVHYLSGMIFLAWYADTRVYKILCRYVTMMSCMVFLHVGEFVIFSIPIF